MQIKQLDQWRIVISQYNRIGQRYLLAYPWIEILIYFGVLLIGLSLVYTISLRGSWQLLRKAQLQTKSLHYQYQSNYVLIASEFDVAQTLSHRKMVFYARLKKLITHRSISHILEDMHQIARKFSLMIVYFSPQNRQSKPFYSQIPLHVIVLGRYQDIVSFLNHLIHYRYRITLHDFQLQPKPIGDKGIGIDPLLKMDMFLHIYVK